jgi:hypothetical protein
MANIINASTSSGLVTSADTSGVVQIQSNGTTELTVESTGVTVADNLLFNSGYGSAAVGYGCRAWVNFNGVTNEIRASGNISSITDNGTGQWNINFTNAMPDSNYSLVVSDQVLSSQTSPRGTGFYSTNLSSGADSEVTSTTCKIACRGGVYQDTFYMCLAFFR